MNFFSKKVFFIKKIELSHVLSLFICHSLGFVVKGNKNDLEIS